MTKREREILKKSVSWTDKSLTVNEEKAFQEGAKWADKTMIDRACKLLKAVGVLTDDDSIMGFRKAMEE